MRNEHPLTIKVRCVGCGHTREALPSEFGPADVPMCERCFMPMATVSVTVRLKSGGVSSSHVRREDG